MKAVYKYDAKANATKLANLKIPEVDPVNNVLVKAIAVTCCGMDNHIYQGKFDCTPPFVMGHEFVGTVQKIASNNSQSKLQVGQRVVCEPHLYACGHCEACLNGAPQSCRERKSLGIQRDGAMAEYVKVPEKYLHVIPDSIPDDVACLIEPMTILYTDMLTKAKLTKGETVAIWGAGPIGIFAAVVAKHAGADKVILVGSETDMEYRMPVAKQVGVDYLISFQQDDPIAKINEITSGKWVDLAVECSGSVKAIQEAITCCKINKRVSFLGLTRGQKVEIDWDSALKKMVTCNFNMMADYRDMGATIDMVAAYPLSLSPIITRSGTLEEYESIFSDLAKGTMVKLMFNVCD